MAKRASNGQENLHDELAVNLDASFKVLAATQDQIRFADTKAAFIFGINTLLFGFVTGTTGIVKKALASDTVPHAAWVSLISLIAFSVMAAVAVAILIYVVMSRFGELAPTSRIFFGHIIKGFGKDYAKYVCEITTMTERDWLEEVGKQIVEISHIALIKHQWVKRAAWFTITGFGFWLVSVFSALLIP